MNEDYIDELFALKLGNMEVAPPEDGWFRIKNELERRVRMARQFWMAAASVAVVLSATASTIYINNKFSNPETTAIFAENTLQQPVEELPTMEELPPAVAAADIVYDEIVAVVSASVPVSSAVFIDENPITSLSSTVENEMYENPIIVAPAHIGSLAKQLPVFAIKTEMLSNQPEPVIKTEEIITAATTFIPVYDDFLFMDLAAVSASPRSRKRWEVTGQFAPVHSYRAISSVPGGLRRSDFDDAESPLLAYSGGISLSYRVFGRLSVQTGVFYSQMGQLINNVTPVPNMYANISSNNAYTRNFVRTSSGTGAVLSNLKSNTNTSYSEYFSTESHFDIHRSEQYQLIERLDYIEIPLMIRYKIVDRKFSFHVLSGVSANVLLETNVFVDNGSEIVKSGTILMARPVNYSSAIGLGIGYQIIKNLSLGIEPTFKYFLQPYTTNSKINANPYAFGIYSGVVYRF